MDNKTMFYDELKNKIDLKKNNTTIYSQEKYEQIIQVLKISDPKKPKEYYWASKKFKIIEVGNIEKLVLANVSDEYLNVFIELYMVS